MKNVSPGWAFPVNKYASATLIHRQLIGMRINVKPGLECQMLMHVLMSNCVQLVYYCHTVAVFVIHYMGIL